MPPPPRRRRRKAGTYTVDDTVDEHDIVKYNCRRTQPKRLLLHFGKSDG